MRGNLGNTTEQSWHEPFFMSLSAETSMSSSAMENMAVFSFPVLMPDLLQGIIFPAHSFISPVNLPWKFLRKMQNGIMLIGQLYLDIHALSFQLRFKSTQLMCIFFNFVILKFLLKMWSAVAEGSVLVSALLLFQTNVLPH